MTWLSFLACVCLGGVIGIFLEICSSKSRERIKEMMRLVLREEIKKTPLIISSRPPCNDDIYDNGTVWMYGNEVYVAEKIRVEWRKQ